MTEQSTPESIDRAASESARHEPVAACGLVDPAGPQPLEQQSTWLPVCPACGSDCLYNAQEVEEGHEYPVLPPRRTEWGWEANYGDPQVRWTVHGVNNLVCHDCEWSVPIDCADALRVLEGPVDVEDGR
jgi:hypothetical protein